MAFKTYTLWIDIEGNRLVSGPASDTAVSTTRFTQGDTALIDINFLKRIDGSLGEVALDGGSTVKVGIGYREKQPTSGTYTLTYDGDTTTALAFDASAAAVAAALNLLGTVTAEGGVTVSQVGDGQVIKWTTGTSHTDFSGDGGDLFPAASVKLVQIESSVIQAVLLHLAQTPVAYSDVWTPIGASVVTIANTVPYSAGVPKVYRLDVTNQPISGYTILTYTDATHGLQGSVSFDITNSAGTLRTALQTLEYTAGDVINVTKVDAYIWDISLRGDHIIDIASSFVVSSKGVTGSLSFATAEVHSFLNGAESGDLVLEVMVETASGEQTILQTDCAIFSDVIDSGAVTPIPFGSCLDEAVANNRFVRRDIDQTPTSGDLNNIWPNLGVLSWDGSDVADALTAAANPSAANPIATMADISGGGGGPFLELTGGLMSGPITFDAVGLQNIAKGTFDNSTGGYNGISLTCAVGYELNWQGGHLVNWYSGSAQTLFVDSPITISHAGGITFSDASVQSTAGLMPTGGSLTANSLLLLSDATFDSELGGWGFGVQNTGTPAQNAYIAYNEVRVSDGAGHTSITPTGITFPDSTTLSTASAGVTYRKSIALAVTAGYGNGPYWNGTYYVTGFQYPSSSGTIFNDWTVALKFKVQISGYLFSFSYLSGGTQYLNIQDDTMSFTPTGLGETLYLYYDGEASPYPFLTN